MSAQANAKVDMERRVIRQRFSAGDNMISKVWGFKESSDSLVGVNASPGTGVHWILTFKKVFYRDPSGSILREKDNPALTYLFDSEYQKQLEFFSSQYQKRLKELTKAGPSAPQCIRDEFAREYGDNPESKLRVWAGNAAEPFRGIYKVDMSSDPSVIKKLIMRVAYPLHVEYQEAKTELSDPEGNFDLSAIPENLESIRKAKDNTARGELEGSLAQNIKLDTDKIDAIHQILERYGDAYNSIAAAVAAVELDSKHFLFQLPDRTVDHSQDFEDLARIGGLDFDKNMSKELIEIDYIYVTLDDESASREVPSDWYSKELGGHLIVGGPSVGPKSTNISNGTNNTISSGKNNNTQEEMEQEIKEEKNKG